MTPECLTLEPFDIKNADTLISWIKDERFLATWCASTFSWPITRSAMEEMLALCASDAPHRQYIQAIEKETGRFVGCFGIRRIDSHGTAGHLSLIIVSPELRGTGAGSAMVRRALDLGFSKEGFNRMQLKVFSCNPAAKRCYEACGMEALAGREEWFDFKDEKWQVFTMVKASDAQ